MQLCRIIYCSLTAVHVSSDIFAHHQEHLNCMYSFWYYSHVSLPADIEAEYKIIFSLDISRYFRSSLGASKLFVQLLVLFSCVVAGWYGDWIWVHIQPRYQPATTDENNTRSCTYSLDVPDDERIYCLKHVEQSGNNKLSYTVASCWSFS